jgi:hypothetical protein
VAATVNSCQVLPVGVVLVVALAEGFSSMRHHDERSQRFKIVASQDWPACTPFTGKGTAGAELIVTSGVLRSVLACL